MAELSPDQDDLGKPPPDLPFKAMLDNETSTVVAVALAQSDVMVLAAAAYMRSGEAIIVHDTGGAVIAAIGVYRG